MTRFLYLSLLVLAVAGCAGTPPFDTARVTQDLTPSKVIAQPVPHLDKMVIWGGIILDTRNQEDSTQIEVLAYPVNRAQRPSLEESPQGRFIIRHQGYLEPVTYTQGRRLSVLGKISETQMGKVGDSDYLYPVIDSEQLKLWPEGYRGGNPRTTFHLGIGVRL